MWARLGLVGAFLAGFWQGGALAAQDDLGAEALSKLRAQFLVDGVLVRHDGPWILEAHLSWPGPGILEGRLELAFDFFGSLTSVVVTRPLAIAPAEQSLRLWMPPVTMRRVPHAPRDLSLRARFVAADGEVDLGATSLVGTPASGHDRVLAIVQPADAVDVAAELALFQALRVESGARLGDVQYLPWGAPLTAMPRLDPYELPANAAELCFADALLLSSAGLPRIDEAPLAAIARWIEAGGSACVLGGAGLRERHVAWLNDLARRGGAAAAIVAADSGGRLRAASGAAFADGIAALTCELGRVVIVLDPQSVDPASPSWRAASAFLARLERRRAESFAVEGAWDWRRSGPAVEWRHSSMRYGAAALGDPVALVPVVELLLPESVRLITSPILLGLLLAFLAAIGPVDWWLLGRLGRRHLSWLTLPSWCVLFLVATTLLAGILLGSNASTRRLTIADIGGDGRVLRENVYEVSFFGSERSVGGELDDAIVTPFGGDAEDSIPSDAFPDAGERRDAPRLGGAPPRRQTLDWLVPPWTPRVLRTLRLAPGEAHLPLAPAAVRWSDIEATVDGAGAPQTFSGTSAAGFSAGAAPDDFRIEVVGARNDLDDAESYGWGSERREPLRRAIRAVTVWPPTVGASAALDWPFDGAAPRGGVYPDDMALLHSSDTTTLVVAASFSAGGDFFVYRRLLRRRAP